MRLVDLPESFLVSSTLLIQLLEKMNPKAAEEATKAQHTIVLGFCGQLDLDLDDLKRNAQAKLRLINYQIRYLQEHGELPDEYR